MANLLFYCFLRLPFFRHLHSCMFIETSRLVSYSIYIVLGIFSSAFIGFNLWHLSVVEKVIEDTPAFIPALEYVQHFLSDYGKCLERYVEIVMYIFPPSPVKPSLQDQFTVFCALSPLVKDAGKLMMDSNQLQILMQQLSNSTDPAELEALIVIMNKHLVSLQHIYALVLNFFIQFSDMYPAQDVKLFVTNLLESQNALNNAIMIAREKIAFIESSTAEEIAKTDPEAIKAAAEEELPKTLIYIALGVGICICGLALRPFLWG